MKDKEFFSRVLGLVEPWRVKEVRLDLEAKRVDVEIECRAGEVWAGEGGKRLHIHGWEQRQWRHLDPMQLEPEVNTWLAKAGASGLAPVKTGSRDDRIPPAGRNGVVLAPDLQRGEGFNCAIQAIKSSARGFRTFANYRIAILFHCGGLQLFPR